MHRRGPAREYRQTIEFGVARQIHQDVDAVGADLLDQRIVRQLPDVAPRVGARAQTLGHRIRRPRTVANVLECSPVACAQDRLKEMSDRARAKVARKATRSFLSGPEPCSAGGAAVVAGLEIVRPFATARGTASGSIRSES